MTKQLVLLCLSVLGVAFVLGWAFSARNVLPNNVPGFNARAIGPPSSSTFYLPYGINDSGLVAGTKLSSMPSQGFIFAKRKLFQVRQPPHLAASQIFGVNDSGIVSGEGCLTATCSSPRAYTGLIRRHNVDWKKLPAPSGSSLCSHVGCDSVANGVGPTGDVTGQFGTQAVVWTTTRRGYSIKRLPFTDSSRFTSSKGLAIDGFGDVVGTESTGQFTVGVLWPHKGKPALMAGCGNFLVIGGATFESPAAVVARGKSGKQTITITGKCLVMSSTHQQGFAPAIWHAHVSGTVATISGPTALDAGNTPDNGRAAGISGMGWIAGNQGFASPTATLWINQTPHLLNSLISPPTFSWSLATVYGINTKGADRVHWYRQWLGVSILTYATVSSS